MPVRIGCSGFNYWHWKGTFYPIDLPQKKWFEYYCKVFNIVELNVTFYRLPFQKTFDRWYKECKGVDGYAQLIPLIFVMVLIENSSY